MKIIRIAAAGAIALSLAACQNAGPKQQMGTLLGAAAGAVAGSHVGKGKGRMAGIAIGTLYGSLIGSGIGQSLDRADRMYMQRTTHRSLESMPTGNTAAWNNPDSGNSGTVTPQRTFQTARGSYCREYQQTISVGGRTEEAYGTACRQPDGTWKVVNN